MAHGTVIGPSPWEADARLAWLCGLSVLAASVLGFAVEGSGNRLVSAVGGAVCSFGFLLPLVGLRSLGRLAWRWRLHSLRFRLHDSHGVAPSLLWPAHLDRGAEGLERVLLVWVAGSLQLHANEREGPFMQLEASAVGAIECLPPANVVRWFFGNGGLALIAPDRDSIELSLQGAPRASRLLRELQAEAGASPEL